MNYKKHIKKVSGIDYRIQYTYEPRPKLWCVKVIDVDGKQVGEYSYTKTKSLQLVLAFMDQEAHELWRMR